MRKPAALGPHGPFDPHGFADTLGIFFPPVDWANAVWYASEGSLENAGVSVLCSVPVYGDYLAVLRAAKNGTKAASTISKFKNLAYASSGIAPYRPQRALTAGKGGSIQAHHLIEKRFADGMGGSTNDCATLVVTREEHQVFTNAWRQAIPYGDGTRNATRADIQGAARQIYADYPEILSALGLG